ncbi:hypothetical protein YA33_12820 [Klebsiella aerogenes]|nr:hypothetical protein YA33_12820 [Klebsiella aerogenes]
MFIITVFNKSYAVMNVTVKVNVIAAPACVINNNKTIEVDFQEIVTTRVDGGNEYRRPVIYTLECDNAENKKMKMMVDATPTTFNKHALQTNIDDLGIELHVNSSKHEINQWINFDYNHKPVIEVVPVKRTGSKLPTGSFHAGATLKVEYP